MNPTFLWHDYETFGSNPRRDRPAQFAAIRTDVALNIIGEPIELFCQPPRDMLPDPAACLLTGITPQVAQQKGKIEAEFAYLIHQILSQAGTCGVGYNTLRFDDEVTRFLFYRNLIDPYGREWQNDCSRWDLLDVVRTMYALRPEGMCWPTREDGLPSFKLEHLTYANGLSHAEAHNALSDVYATIALAQKIRERQPRLFSYCFALRKKARVSQEINLLHPKPIIHISGMYAASKGCMAIVLPLMTHPKNSNEIIVYDLAYDPTEFIHLTSQAIQHRLFSSNDLLRTEGLERVPLKSIHLNKSPVVISNLNTLTSDNLARWEIDLKRAEQYATQLLAHAELRSTLCDVYSSSAEYLVDIDERLYSGFIHPKDRQILDQLRQLTPNALSQARSSFHDAKLAELVLRYRSRNWPETLSYEEYEQWEALRSARLIDGIDGHMPIDHYLVHLKSFIAQATLTQQQEYIIEQLYQWAETIVPATTQEA